MLTWLANAAFQKRRLVSGFLNGFLSKTLAVAALLTVGAPSAFAQPAGESAGGEASLKLPDLSSVSFLNGAIDGHRLLMIGILFCLFGLSFGMVIFLRLKNLPVHRSMREISELIYETCKTYLVTQGRFILLLWAFIAVIILLYFGVLQHMEAMRVAIILGFSPAGGEASLKLPDLSSVSFLNGAIDGHRLLMIGILFCLFGLSFGMVIFLRLKNLPVHRSMREISELIDRKSTRLNSSHLVIS